MAVCAVIGLSLARCSFISIVNAGWAKCKARSCGRSVGRVNQLKTLAVGVIIVVEGCTQKTDQNRGIPVGTHSAGTFEKAYVDDRSCFGSQPSLWLRSLPDGWYGRGGTAVDLGCGHGRNGIYVARRGMDVLALDLSPSAIRELNELSASEGLDMTGICSDIRNHPLPPCRLVIAVTVLSVLTEADIRELSVRLAESLVPGGMLLLEDFTRKDPGSMGAGEASEFAPLIQHYFLPSEVPGLFPALQTVTLCEFSTVDTSHGPTHRHWIVRYVGCKGERDS